VSDQFGPAATPPIHVLYVHHAGVFGGASRSLVELFKAFPADSVAPHVIVQRGTVADMLRQAGVPVIETRGITQFDCTLYGYYRGMRWLILLREVFYLPFTIYAMLEARRRWRHIDLVHINDTTPAAAIALAGRFFQVPVVVHARALLAGQVIPRRMRFLATLLTRRAQAVIAIDESVRASLPAQIDAHVVHNGFAPGLGPKTAPPPLLAKLSPPSLKIAMVGSVSAMKGVYEFVEAARIVAGKRLEVDFIFVGDDIRPLKGLRGWLIRALGFGRPVRTELERLVADHGLKDRVHFVGFTTEIKGIYDAIDVICFPSHLDAPGRPVFEAAFSGVPSIVAMRDPRPDTLIDGETGLCIPARDPQALAAAIERMYHDRAAVKRMGERARALALANFDIRRNAEMVLNVYRRLLV
jgi:glycosyltransferase involved in cell wall biosynthesis